MKLEYLLKDNFLRKLKKNGRINVFPEMEEETNTVVNMYTSNPFPNYNGFQNKADLIDQIENNVFLKDLKKHIGYGKSFIEVGSGTCQLSLGLAAGTNNSITALDSTLASLKLGENFAKENNINNVHFINADIFKNPIKASVYDYVWSSGVLHHTKNSKEGFLIISEWLKPSGIIIIGLYNKYGRFWTNIRQFLFKILGSKSLARHVIKFLDPNLRKSRSKEQEDAWIIDQYAHPIERSHTLDEVLGWFSEAGIDYIGSIPDANLDGTYIGFENMNGNKGTLTTRIAAQVGMLFTRLGSEDGLYIAIGKKK